MKLRFLLRQTGVDSDFYWDKQGLTQIFLVKIWRVESLVPSSEPKAEENYPSIMCNEGTCGEQFASEQDLDGGGGGWWCQRWRSRQGGWSPWWLGRQRLWPKFQELRRERYNKRCCGTNVFFPSGIETQAVSGAARRGSWNCAHGACFALKVMGSSWIWWTQMKYVMIWTFIITYKRFQQTFCVTVDNPTFSHWPR